MRHILPIVGPLLILLAIFLFVRSRRTAPDREEQGSGLLVFVLLIGASVAIAAFWFFLTWLEFAS